MEVNSEIAANRTIIAGKDGENQKIRKAVRCRDRSLYEIYNSFDFNDELAFSTFCKYIGPEFKNPFRQSDLCDWKVFKIAKHAIFIYF